MKGNVNLYADTICNIHIQCKSNTVYRHTDIRDNRFRYTEPVPIYWYTDIYIYNKDINIGISYRYKDIGIRIFMFGYPNRGGYPNSKGVSINIQSLPLPDDLKKKFQNFS